MSICRLFLYFVYIHTLYSTLYVITFAGNRNSLRKQWGLVISSNLVGHRAAEDLNLDTGVAAHAGGCISGSRLGVVVLRRTAAVIVSALVTNTQQQNNINGNTSYNVQVHNKPTCAVKRFCCGKSFFSMFY